MIVSFCNLRNRSRRLPLVARLVFGASLLALVPALSLAQSNVELGKRLNRLERALDNKGLLELAQQIDFLQQELRQLRGEIENQVFVFEQLRKSQRESYLDSDRRLQSLEKRQLAAQVPSLQAGMQPSPTLDPPLPTLDPRQDGSVAGTPSQQTIAVETQRRPALNPPAGADATQIESPGLGLPVNGATDLLPSAPTTVAAVEEDAVPVPAIPPIVVPAQPSIAPLAPTIDSAESEAAYRAAFATLKAGQYEESIAKFSAFLQQYPASQYADNAQYWLGEAYYVMRQFEQAIEHYQKLVETYPDSKKQSHGMLKIGYSFHELGLAEQAQSVLLGLKNHFPGSAAARLADERLQRIRSENL